jgi:hypothetical protein
MRSRVGVRSRRELRWNADAEVLQKADKVPSPSRSHGSRAERIFQDQVPANDPGKNLTQGGIAIGISRAGNGNQGSEFGIAQPGEHATGSGQNERQHDCRPGVLSGCRSGQNEDARADDGADTQRDQVNRAQSPLKAVFPRLRCLLRKHVEGFALQEIG